jgi:putative FmdB family regulatory protein
VPVYQYACTECAEQLEVRQSFTDDALTVCPACGGPLRKVLSAVGVVFKGSGFYRTDSRTSSGEKASAASNGAGDSKDSSSTGKESTKTGSSATTSNDSSSSTPAAATG